MKYTVHVTQRHIDDAFSGMLWIGEQTTCCPIALALYEQVGKGSYKLKRREGWRGMKRIEFGKSNMFSVADTILWQGYGLPEQKGFLAPRYIKHSKKTATFVKAFDNNEEVKPFSFKIELPY